MRAKTCKRDNHSHCENNSLIYMACIKTFSKDLTSNVHNVIFSRVITNDVNSFIQRIEGVISK